MKIGSLILKDKRILLFLKIKEYVYGSVYFLRLVGSFPTNSCINKKRIDRVFPTKDLF